MNKCLFVWLAHLFLVSCDGGSVERRINHFEVKSRVDINRVQIEEILHPIDMIVLKDYLVFHNSNMDKSDCFFVYNSETYAFCFSFGQKGMGPGEYIAPRIIKSSEGNNFSVIDTGRNIIREYVIQENDEMLLVENKIGKLTFPIQEMSFVNDSIALILYYTNEDVYLLSYNLEAKNIVDTLFFDTGFKKKMGHDFNSTYNDFNFCNIGNKFVVIFLFVNEILSGELNEEGRFIKKDYKLKNCDFIPEMEIYDNINYYNYPQMDEHYIYAQYYGGIYRRLAPPPFNLRGRNSNYSIEIYNHELKPVTLVEFECNSFRFYIDPYKSRVYFWDPLSDFEHLSIFPIPDLTPQENIAFSHDSKCSTTKYHKVSQNNTKFSANVTAKIGSIYDLVMIL